MVKRDYFKDRKQRDEFLKYTNSKGIMTRPIWELMNRLPMFKDCQCGDLKNVEWLEESIVNIPSSIINDRYCFIRSRWSLQIMY